MEISVEGEPLELTVVGRHAEFFNSNNVVITSLETYQEQIDPHAQPQLSYLRLEDHAIAEDLQTEWLEESYMKRE